MSSIGDGNPAKKISQTPLLDKVSFPSDLRKFSGTELKQLCSEIREELVRRVNESGGHFASSLGVTEITVALHYLFNTPKDQIVWDVGHQAYVHKMLTGRRDDLSRVRCLGGISGFPRPCESEYDAFCAGHAGTSISAAAGLTEANYHLESEENRGKLYSIAVIGDGAITSGMAFEALNHAGQLHRNLIVVLNDNEMSIAPNVGALSWAFSRTLTSKFSTSARKHFRSLVQRGLIPKSFYRTLDKAEEVTQGFFSTPAMLFESFGFRYIGPVDGHSISQLIQALERAKQQDCPVLVHALTVKGKGFEPAEDDPVKYHAVGKFALLGQKKIGACDAEPTVIQKKALTYTEVFGKTMLEMCCKDSRVVGITAAMPDGTGLNLLAQEMPERFYDTAIAEQHAVVFAAGLAAKGMRPVCAIYSSFMQRAIDQIMHDVCLQSLPVIFALDRAGLVGEDGPTHHGVFDLAYLRIFPNLTIMSPKDELELRDMMFAALINESGPTAIRYPRGQGIGRELSLPINDIPIGKAEIVFSSSNCGASVLLLAIGQTVYPAIESASILSDSGISCTVVNARFVKPLDSHLIYDLILKHDYVLTIEDHSLSGGFGSAVLESISDSGFYFGKSIVRLGIPDRFIEHGTQAQQRRICEIDKQAIIEKVMSLCWGNKVKVQRRA